MKLGTQTGSLMNHIMANTSVEEITVGTPATFLSWTDRHPGTIIDVYEKGKFTYLKVRRDDVVYHKDRSGNFDIVDGSDDNVQMFRFKTDGSSGFQKYGLNPYTNRYGKIGDGGLAVGFREYYYDPSF